MTPRPPFPIPTAPHGTHAVRGTHAVHLVFGPAAPMPEVADTLELALLSAEALYGADRVRLDAAWAVDPEAGTVTIDTSSAAGHALALLFLGLVRREFGDAAVRVHRVRAAAAAIEGTEVAQ